MNSVPRFIYKYLSAEAFKLVAQSHKLQWSLPTAFNDPFDFQIEVQLGVPKSLARKYIATRLARLVLHPKEWRWDYPLWMHHAKLPSVFPFVIPNTDIYTSMKSSLDGLSLHNAAKVVARDFSSNVDLVLANIYAIMAAATQTSKRDFDYVLCLSEVNDNILMWSHYGQSHTGVVLEFSTEANSWFSASRLLPVRYEDGPPSFFEECHTRYYMTGELDPQMHGIFRKFHIYEEQGMVLRTGMEDCHRPIPRRRASPWPSESIMALLPPQRCRHLPRLQGFWRRLW